MGCPRRRRPIPLLYVIWTPTAGTEITMDTHGLFATAARSQARPRRRAPWMAKFSPSALPLRIKGPSRWRRAPSIRPSAPLLRQCQSHPSSSSSSGEIRGEKSVAGEVLGIRTRPARSLGSACGRGSWGTFSVATSSTDRGSAAWPRLSGGASRCVGHRVHSASAPSGSQPQLSPSLSRIFQAKRSRRHNCRRLRHSRERKGRTSSLFGGYEWVDGRPLNLKELNGYKRHPTLVNRTEVISWWAPTGLPTYRLISIC